MEIYEIKDGVPIKIYPDFTGRKHITERLYPKCWIDYGIVNWAELTIYHKKVMHRMEKLKKDLLEAKEVIGSYDRLKDYIIITGILAGLNDSLILYLVNYAKSIYGGENEL